jgi:hypothetical protein
MSVNVMCLYVEHNTTGMTHLKTVCQPDDGQLWPKHVATLLNEHSCAGRIVYGFVTKKKLRNLKHCCDRQCARIVVFDVNGCSLLVKYVRRCVCVCGGGDSIDVH